MIAYLFITALFALSAWLLGAATIAQQWLTSTHISTDERRAFIEAQAEDALDDEAAEVTLP